MISEAERNTLIEDLHSVVFDWTVGQVVYPLDPKIVRHMEDTNREEDFIVVEFRPTTRKYGLSINQVTQRRENENYSEFGYGEEEIVSVVSMVRSKSYAHGRDIATEWLRRIQYRIRVYWEGLVNPRIIKSSFSPYIEETNLFVERQYVYRFDFLMVSHHGWTNEPPSELIPAPDLSGAEIENILVWVE